MADSIEIIDLSQDELDPYALANAPEPKGDPQKSVLLRPHKVSKELRLAIKTLAESLLVEIAAHPDTADKQHKDPTNKRRETMIYVLLNLFTAWRRFDPKTEARTNYLRPYVAYPRDRNFYIKSKWRLSRDYFVECVDGLERLGLIECVPGFFDHETHVGYRSRMRARKGLIVRMLDCHIDRDQVHPIPPNPIELKARKDKKTGVAKYLTVSEWMLKRLEPKVRRINDMLDQANVKLRITQEERAQIMLHNSAKEDEELTISPMPDPRRIMVYRTFNNNSLKNKVKEGGRFYGHWVQGIPRDFRESNKGYLYINESPAVELDFSAYHIRMLYGGKKPPVPVPPGDPYTLNGLDHLLVHISDPETRAKALRDVVKLTVNTLLNAESEHETIGSIMFGRSKKKRSSKQTLIVKNQAPTEPKVSIARKYRLDLEDVQDIIAAIKNKHPAIAADLHSGVGVRLQFIDSEIAQAIMLTLWDKHKIPSIPLHDSFIVAKEHADTLRQVMLAETARVFGEPMPLDVKHGGDHYTLPVVDVPAGG